VQILGTSLRLHTATTQEGLDFALAANLTAGASYSGQFGQDVQDNAVKSRFTWLF
jgi:uncharacterized protein with beta-barrel porin domain